MTTNTIVTIVLFAAILTAVPLLNQEADAAIAFVPNEVGQVTFEHEVAFSYDMADNYKIVDTEMEYTLDNVRVGGQYVPLSDVQIIHWNFPETVNFMLDLTEYSTYAAFSLDSIEYKIQSDGNGQIDGSSLQNEGYHIHRDQTSDSGMVYIQIVGKYVWTPMGT